MSSVKQSNAPLGNVPTNLVQAEGTADLPNTEGSRGAAKGEATNCLRLGE